MYLPSILLFFCLTLPSTVRGQDDSISIIFTGNIMGTILPVDSSGATCSPTFVEANPAASSCFGGQSRRQSFIQSLVAAQPNRTLILDGGASFWGSPLFLQFGPAYMGKMMARVGYSALSLGLTDFLPGPLSLSSYINQFRLHAPLGNKPTFLCSNVDVSRDPNLKDLVKRFQVFHVGKYTVGVFGIIDPQAGYRTLQTPLITFNVLNANSNTTVPLFTIISAMVNTLRGPQYQCDVVILLTDLFFNRIVDEVKQVSGVDLVLTTDYADSDPSKGEINQFPMWLETYSSSVQLSDRFMIAGGRAYRGAAVVQVNLTFTSGQLNLLKSTAIRTSLDVRTQTPPQGDPVTWGETKTLMSELNSIQSQTISYSSTRIDGVGGTNLTEGNAGCRFTDCAMGRLFTSALLDWCPTCDIAIVNGGTMRSSFPAGNITLLAIMNTFPFRTPACYFFAKGSTIFKALVNMKVQGGLGWGSYLQVAGFRFAWNPDLTVPPEQSVLAIEAWDRVKQAYVPFDLTKIYKVVSSLYLRSGGDGYTMFQNEVTNAMDAGPTEVQTMTNYLARFNVQNPIPPYSRANFTSCFTTAHLPLSSGAGDCHVITSPGANDLLSQCPTQSTICLDHSHRTGGLVLDEFYVNSSTCGRCTGLGTCADHKCTCQQPNRGLFAGLPVVSGEDCGKIRNVRPLGSSTTTFLYFLAGLTALVGVVTAACLWYSRDIHLIAVTTPMLGLVTCAGCLVSAVGILCLAQPLVQSSLCQTWLWCTSFAYSLGFASIFVRSYRLHQIFYSSKNQIVSDGKLLVMVGVVLLIDTVILLWWQLTQPMIAIGALYPGDENGLAIKCQSPLAASVGYATFIFKGLLTLWGFYLTRKVSHIRGSWNEVKQITIVVYNAAISVLLLVPIVYSVQDARPDVFAILKGVLMGYISMFTLMALYGYRFYLIFTDSDLDEEVLEVDEEDYIQAKPNQSLRSNSSNRPQSIRLPELAVSPKRQSSLPKRSKSNLSSYDSSLGSPLSISSVSSVSSVPSPSCGPKSVRQVASLTGPTSFEKNQNCQLQKLRQQAASLRTTVADLRLRLSKYEQPTSSASSS